MKLKEYITEAKDEVEKILKNYPAIEKKWKQRTEDSRKTPTKGITWSTSIDWVGFIHTPHMQKSNQMMKYYTANQQKE